MNIDPRYIKVKDRPKPGRGKGSGFLYQVGEDLINITEVARLAKRSVHFTQKYLVEGSVSASDFIKRFKEGKP